MTTRAALIWLCVALTGCALPSNPAAPVAVSQRIEGEILINLAAALSARFAPAKTQLTLTDATRNKHIEGILRNMGYAVHTQGTENLIAFSVYYINETGGYLGVMQVGPAYTLSRQYIYDDGELVAGTTTLADGDKETTDE